MLPPSITTTVLPAGDPRHGLPVGVDAGCSCNRCRLAATRMTRVFDANRGGVCRYRATRRLRALRAIGHTPERLAAAIGCHLYDVLGLCETAGTATVRRDLFARIAAAYEPLSARPGVGSVAEFEVAWAKNMRWMPPLAWDNIDDRLERPSRDARWCPDADCEDSMCPLEHKARKHDTVDESAVARVMAGELVPTTRAEKETITARWLAAGRTWDSLESFTGWHLEKYRKEAGTAA